MEGEGSLSVTEGGTAVESGSRIAQGKTVTVTPVPAEGNRLASIMVNGTALDSDGITSSQPLEIEINSDVDIMAKFSPAAPEAKMYEVSIIPDSHATITLSSESGPVESGTEVVEGTEIKVNVTTDDGYGLDGIFLNGAPLESESFIVRVRVRYP